MFTIQFLALAPPRPVETPKALEMEGRRLLSQMTALSMTPYWTQDTDCVGFSGTAHWAGTGLIRYPTTSDIKGFLCLHPLAPGKLVYGQAVDGHRPNDHGVPASAWAEADACLESFRFTASK